MLFHSIPGGIHTVQYRGTQQFPQLEIRYSGIRNNRTLYQYSRPKSCRHPRHTKNDRLTHLFGEHDARTTFWLQHIEQITSITSHVPSGVIAVQHTNGIVIEWDTKPRECWIFDSRFWIDWLELKWKPGQIRIPEPQQKIVRRGDWQTELQRHLHDR